MTYFIHIHGRPALFGTEMEEEWKGEWGGRRRDWEKRERKLWPGCKINN